LYVFVKGWMSCAVEGFTVHFLFLIINYIPSRFHSGTCFHGRVLHADGEEADRFLRDFCHLLFTVQGCKFFVQY
jgi:hypothetical protein